MPTALVTDLDSLYRLISDEIDVGEARYEDAENRYKAVSAYLDAHDSTLRPYRPHIYVQGSFSLGTATKPFGPNGEYDVDAVCTLRSPPVPTDQRWLRDLIGNRLLRSPVYGPMIMPREGKRRCWRIQYHDGSKFHLDVCPAVPQDVAAIVRLGVAAEIADGAIFLTDSKDLSQWIIGNALGYRRWFMSRMQVRLAEERQRLAASVRARAEDIPEYKARTTLQRVVQILKRHRDVRYDGDDDKPISIIITTLAAQAYDNDPRLDSALRTIIRGMRDGIKREGDVYVVRNPVDPRENFADKWRESPRKAAVFFAWLDALDEFDETLQSMDSEDEVVKRVREAFGEIDGEKAVRRYLDEARRRGSTSRALSVRPTLSPIRLPPAPHVKIAPWLAAGSSDTANLSCSVYRTFFRLKTLQSGEPIEKNRTLRFSLQTTVKKPYEVHWQVVNTGEEAAREGCLRGDFYEDEIKRGGMTREETTLYTGTHWVEAFVVKNGRLAARSGRFVVSIR